MKSVLEILILCFLFNKCSSNEVKVFPLYSLPAGKSPPHKPKFAFFLIVTYTCLGKRELLTVKNAELRISGKE